MHESDDIKRKVLEINEKHHDRVAKTHTRSVPYQCRKFTRSYIWKLITEQLKQNKVDPKNSNVLEVGCGTGTFVELFNNLCAKSYTGIDISSEMIRLAKKNNKYNYAKFVKCSLEDFCTNTLVKYDIIISSSFLHHLYNFEYGIMQIKSMLKPGGIYIGLHEVMNDRKRTKLEVFDYQLAYLMGYTGGKGVSFKKRFFGFIKYILSDLKIQKWQSRKLVQYFTDLKIYSNKLLWTSAKLEGETRGGVSKPSIPDLNYVDYQLNFKFNLQTNVIAKKYGRVVPYCYYNFAELRYLQSINNHVMFIMIN